MAKRFIDTKMWDKAWFRKLTPETKLIWLYLLTRCDHAGIWDADWEAAEFFIGSPVNYRRLPKVITDKMYEMDGGNQYFIHSFIEFQYGKLSEKSKPHQSVIKRLEEKGLITVFDNVYTVKDKDKEKEKPKVKTKTKKKDKEAEFARKSFIIAQELKVTDEMLKDFVNYWTESNEGGIKMKFEMQKTFDIKRRLQRWHKNDFGNNQKPKVQETNFKKLETGYYKAYCSKCGGDLYPTYQGLKDSSCCGVEMVAKKPELKLDHEINTDIFKNLAKDLSMKRE